MPQKTKPAKAPRANKPKRPRRPRDMTQPYQQRHTVTIEMDGLEAELYAPAKLRRLQEERPGALAKTGPALEEHYIVTTRRRDLEWEFTIAVGDQEWRIPAQVVERIIEDRKLIISAQASDRALEQVGKRAAARAAKKAQEETEDLAGDETFLSLNGNVA